MVSINLNLLLPIKLCALIFLAFLVCSQHWADAVYYDFSSAFDLVPYALLLHKLTNYGLCAGYINWFHSYLTNRLDIHCSGAVITICSITLCLSRICVRAFAIYSNDLCNVIEYSNYLLSLDDIPVFQAIKTSHDCSFLQMDINCLCGWRTANHMKIDVSKTSVISFTRKSTVIWCLLSINLFGSHINHLDTVTGLGIVLDTKLYFHYHMDCIFLQVLKLLGSVLCCNFFSHL
jgi:hypothetical protein